MPDNLSTYLEAMRNFYHSGQTRPYEWRKTQLEKLYSILEKEEDRIAKALHEDLRKPVTEAYVTETGMLKAEIRFALKQLRRWMKPERTGTNFLNFPSRSRIYKEPLGVALIIAPWNYPVMLSLLPLVSAVAAGNCVVLKPSELAPASSA